MDLELEETPQKTIKPAGGKGTRTFDIKLDKNDHDWSILGKQLQRRANAGYNSLDDRYSYIIKWHQQYDAIRIPKNFPWPNSASLNVPTTRSIVDSIHARALRTFHGVNPLARVEAITPDDVSDAQQIEKLLDWQLKHQVGIQGVWDRCVMNSLKDGNCFAEIGWRREYRRVRDIEPVLIDPSTGKETDDETIGQPKMDDSTGEVEMQLVEKDELVANHPSVRVISAMDFFMYPANAETIESAVAVGYRFWATRNDLYKGVRDGIYDADSVEKLCEKSASMDGRRQDNSGADPTMTAMIGVEPTMMDGEDNEYEMVKMYGLYDYNGDGIKEDCEFVVDRNSGVCVMANIAPFWHGRRPFVSFTPYPRDRSMWGYSMPEILEHPHSEINAIRNQRVDAGTLLLAPMLAVGRGSRTDLNSQYWTPGGYIKVDDVAQIKPLSFQSGVTQSAFAEEQKAREVAEDVSGVSAYASGQSPSRSRTLGEINSVLAEGNLKFDVVIRRFQEANTEILEQILQLDYQFLDAKTEFAITGGNGQRIFSTITRDQIKKRYKIYAQGNSLNSNKELLIQIAETLYQISQTNPLIQGNLERIWAVSNYYLQQAGVTDPSPYIGTEEDAKKQMQEQQSQPAPTPMDAVKLSGKLDEITTLAMLMQADPSLMPHIQEAMSVYAQAGQSLTDAAVQAGAQQSLDQNGWGQQVPGGLQTIPTDPGRPEAAPGEAENLNHVAAFLQLMSQQGQQGQPQGAMNG